MSEYLDRAKEILKELSKHGCESYIIGEAARSEITKEEPTEVEIVTTTSPSKIQEIFSDYKFEPLNSSKCIISIGQFEYIIKTFEKNSEARKIKELKNVYSKNLKEELASRTFVLDTISMTATAKYTDPYKASLDIRSKKISPTDNAKRKIKESPLQIFKVLRCYATTNYRLSPKLVSAIKSAKKGLKQFTLVDYYRDLKVILDAKKYKKLYEILYKLSPKSNMIFIGDALRVICKKNVKVTFDQLLAIAMIINKDVKEEYCSLFSDYDLYKKAVTVAISNPKCNFDNITMYKTGLESLLVANRLLTILGKAKKLERKITKSYNKLPIKNSLEVELSLFELKENCDHNEKCDSVYEKAINAILTKELANDRDVILSYCIDLINGDTIEQTTTIEESISSSISSTPTVDEVNEPEKVVNEKPVENNYGYGFNYNPNATQTNEPYQESQYALGGSVYNQKVPNYNNQARPYNPNLYSDGDVSIENKYPRYNQYEESIEQIKADFGQYKYQQLMREINEMKRKMEERDQQFVSLQKSTLIAKLRNEVEQLVQTSVSQLESLGLLNTQEEKMVYTQNQKGMYLNMLLQKPEYQILSKEDLINEKN